MTPATTATGSGHASTANPFDEIVALEQVEEERLEKALKDIAAEEQELKKSLTEKEQTAENEAREQAKAELQDFKKEELPPILTKADKAAQEAVKKVEQAYEKQAATLTKNLVETFLDPSFLSHQ